MTGAHRAPTACTSRNRPVVGKGRQRDEEILICTKISVPCLHTPAHAMIAESPSCVKWLQNESFMAALSCTEHEAQVSARKENFPSQLFRPFKYLL